ncbi:bile acid:sodium symporter family protein [Marichromatium gracile]|uniref:bile acid:sodium symporter family protein n=1 Tax=Marichromatium gracile TaxID=1048 RepID=UPI001F1C3B99|nr:bile acid:sodium symporter family protein [Marichromatium gracile]MCF1183067.1 bile acid:sodium symporter family protein [Marichromatium gracile]
MDRITSLFPLWALAASLLALTFPEPLAALKPGIVPLLGVVMFGMGATLSPGQFTAVLRRPGVIGLGVASQYLLMPFAAWAIGLALGLPPQLLAGLVLVGAAPGGTASNVICYLARGDLALSIILTTVSTLLAVVLTPVLTLLYVGERVAVPALDMFWSILRIVLVPVALGVLVNRLLGARVAMFERVFPLISVAAIVFIIAVIVALNHDQLVTLGPLVALAVVLHNLTGLSLGYTLARLLGQGEARARTLAIEVGMQNSGLAVALAIKSFSAAAALPGALFSIWHNLSGALLAAWWSRRPPPSGA